MRSWRSNHILYAHNDPRTPDIIVTPNVGVTYSGSTAKQVITAFVLAAEILEGLTVGRGRRAIEDMLDFLPQPASVLRDGQIVYVSTPTILPGEIVLIRPGSRIPVDGQVVSGQSFVEEAAITGEPMPREKTAGNEVFAGTINQAGSLQVRADRLGNETAFGKIIEAVERAEHSRAPIQKTADRLAGYLVYFALGAAVLTFLLTHNVRSTISVIIVACNRCESRYDLLSGMALLCLR